jgi:Zn-dependent peptidase ImmA (M78 family)/transcriptional regulator with XRE-family HTH domain
MDTYRSSVLKNEPMNNHLNPSLVTLAREMRGITQKELVQKVPNLTQGNLSRMEKGLLNIPADTLEQIASQLNFPVKFFYQEDLRNPIPNLYYRKRISLPKKDLQNVDATMAIISSCIDNLLNSVELGAPNLPKVQISDNITPADVARIARTFFKINTGPIDNLSEAIEKKGIIIKELDLKCEKFDGITLVTKKSQPVLYINSNLPSDRKRFTISHELGHLMMHIPFEFNDINSQRDFEKEANMFAAEFLMPELEIRKDLNYLTYSKLSLLKEYWKTSKSSIVFRAHQLGCITSDKYKYLQIELSRQGERRKEKVDVKFYSPGLLYKIVDFFMTELQYSTVDLCDYLSISIKDFQNFFTPQDNVKLRVVR